MQLPKIIYIAGYGRSGSTLLDITLSQGHGIFSGGELSSITHFLLSQHSLCACGLPLFECPVWGDILNRMMHYLNVEGISPLAFQRLQKHIESVFSLAELKAFGKWFIANKSQLDIYTRFYKELFGAIGELGFDYVIDSSKSSRWVAARPVALHRLIGAPLTLFHLSRHPQAVIQSMCKGSNRDLEKGIIRKRRFPIARPCLGWTGANISASIASQLIGREKSVFIRYEDFISNPSKEVKKLCIAAKLDPTRILRWLIDDQQNSKNHTLGGNRVRFENVRIDPTRGNYKANFPSSLNWLLYLMIRPLIIKYSYDRVAN